jgi:glycosyltransferase domain-containing protein
MKNTYLSKLTLVIPTYERQEYALRNMKYWSNKDVCVMVLDGSDQPIDSELLSPLVGQNIIYEHSPCSSMQRLMSVLPKLNTKYVAMLSDDEFYIPSAIEACIYELENDVSLVSCFGRCILFNHHKGALKTKLAYKNMTDYSVQHSNPDDRVLYHMNNYRPSTICSIMRTDVWKSAISCIDDDLYKVFALGELQFEIASSYLGKSKVLPVLLWMCSGENTGITDKKKVKKINNWWVDRSNYELREKMLNGLVLKLIGNQKGIDIEHVKKVITKSIELYIAAIPKKQSSVRSIVVSQVAKLLSMLPRAIKDILKRPAHIAYYNLKNFDNINVSAAHLKDEGVSVHLNELKDVENIVVNFHNNLSRG